jgi:hypothetical protein
MEPFRFLCRAKQAFQRFLATGIPILHPPIRANRFLNIADIVFLGNYLWNGGDEPFFGQCR